MKRISMIFGPLLLICSCGDKTPSFALPENLYTIEKIYDVANNNNASDVRLEITTSQALVTTDIVEVRLIVVKTAKSFSQDQMTGLATGNYHSIPIQTTSREVIKLPSSIHDVDGDAIVNGIDYKVYVGILGKQNSKQLSTAAEITLQDKNIYTGIYKGAWEDLGPPGPAVTPCSIRLNDGFGEFFFTPNLKPFIRGANDGTFQMTVVGTSFSFSLQLFIEGYKGGCPATGPVKGHFEDDVNLVSDVFSWDDCDGKRDVQLKFTRQ